MGQARENPGYVFSKIKLDKTGNKLFENPDFNVWVAYTRMVVKDDLDRAIFTFLSGRYGEAALMKMAEQPPRLTVRRCIEATREGGRSSDQLKSEYVVKVAKANTGARTPMITTLRAHFKDQDLIKVFKATQNNPETKKLGKTLEESLVSLYRFQRRKNGH
ncbi:hypothetical protein GQ600_11583 [Phytophthora cactorum]|nr:hypothetical protein GQ600_11583 [Phytophthora cactorum]